MLKLRLTLGAALVLLVAAPAAVAAAADNPSEPTPTGTPPATTAPATPVAIDVVTVNGTGCPAGTTKVEYSENHASLIVRFDSAIFRAQSGGGAAATDARKNCQMALSIAAPEGYAYTIDRTDIFGYAELGDAAKGISQTGFYYQGMSATTTVSNDIEGPAVANWQTTDTPAASGLGNSPCGEQRYLNVNLQVRASGGTDALSYVSADTFVLNQESIRWTKC